VSDTALWVAAYRARESARPDAVFRDPHAAALAGERGMRIVEDMARRHPSWPLVARTWLIDRMLEERLAGDFDLVVNLAAGLDTRPYRLKLSEKITWIEVDLAGITEYKTKLLEDAEPACRLERIVCDLSDAAARRALLSDLDRRFKKALVITEGLLVYLSTEQATGLAKDMAAASAPRSWIADLASPSLLKMLQKSLGPAMAQAPMKFAPADGPRFFEPFGWRPVDARGLLRAAGEIRRLPPLLRLFSWLPEGKAPWKRRAPWGGVCSFERTRA